MFSPPPFLCHFCSWDVHANSGFSSFSSHRSFVDFASNRVNLQIFSIKAEIWLQKPTLPATQVQLLSKTSPLTIHKASFNVWRIIFPKAMTAFSYEIKAMLMKDRHHISIEHRLNCLTGKSAWKIHQKILCGKNTDFFM